ncbi:putative phospholipid-binding lipoprotein MlaA [Tepidimonas alkaliphilus]|uniref:Putative phospholipid-binding lipoprotein MlaA n=1 Tax=Tepidimonas alkaliphilus TaxID=2588942 RepID=A0A554W9I8_9BURK|nr:VacJ family lipoprotein [Tepidimonas alkaliphilus]TSE20233.1 putative phospholipid-binding lipoprotein MlaA [Tepidimonas alkaliphilus]
MTHDGLGGRNLAARWRWGVASGLLASALLGGCATAPDAHPADPLEPLNRGVYRFNEALDEAVLKPVAKGYVEVVPQPLRTGVGNFFANWRDLWSAVNATLQARPQPAAENFMRFAVNTVFGLLGVLDVASEMGIPRTTLDFGHTLGRWGVPAGPYLVLPLLGPSTVRDTVALPVDRRGDAVAQGIDDVGTRNAAQGLRWVDTRAGLLRAGDLLDQVALDKYSFTRDAYLARRQRQVQQARGEEDQE